MYLACFREHRAFFRMNIYDITTKIYTERDSAAEQQGPRSGQFFVALVPGPKRQGTVRRHTKLLLENTNAFILKY